MGKKGKRTDKLGVFMMLLCAVCLSMGQFVWKRYDGLLPLIIGFGIYGLGALTMLCAYRFGSLSVLQPINSVSYVIAAVLGNIFFNEIITTGKVIGIVSIMVGVFLLAKGEVTE